MMRKKMKDHNPHNHQFHWEIGF